MTRDLDALSRRNSDAWDALYRSTEQSVWGAEPLPFVTELLPHAAPLLEAGARALDAGTGEGRHLGSLMAHGAAVVGVDYSLSGIAKIDGALRERATLLRCDLERLPFADASFDFALSVDVIETVVHPDIVLGELARVLRPGGMLLCNIPGEDDEIAGVDMAPAGTDGFLFHGDFFYRFVAEDEAVGLLEHSGFRVRHAQSCSWTEDAHPNFRDEAHQHTSRVFLVERSS